MKTIWIDTISPGREVLVKLSKVLNTALNHIRNEEREPMPHITIGRVKSARNKDILLRKIDELKHIKLGSIEVKSIKLKKSILSQDGPTYSNLMEFRLKP